MGKSKSVSDLTRRQAADHFARLLSGETTAAEAEQIRQWCASSEGRCEEFQSISELCADLQSLSSDKDIQGILSRARDRTPAPTRNRHIVAIVASVAIAALIVSALLPFQGGADRVVSEHYSTRIGERRVLNLEDGSKITMNTGSELATVFTPERRRVLLLRGEAFFEVSEDPSRPFSVVMNGKAVTVLGTTFNVQKTPNGFVLAVVDGVVSLHREAEEAQTNAPILKDEVFSDPYQRRIAAGTVAEFDAVNRVLEGQRIDDLHRYQDWVDGSLSFTNESLATVVASLNRYSGKKILIEDSDVMNLKIYATLNPERLDSTFIVLEKMLPIEIVHYFDRIVIKSKG